jgi:hypothetical protein
LPGEALRWVWALKESEEVTGRALREFARREEIVIATKVCSPMRPGPNGRGLSRKAILQEIALYSSMGEAYRKMIDGLDRMARALDRRRGEGARDAVPAAPDRRVLKRTVIAGLHRRSASTRNACTTCAYASGPARGGHVLTEAAGVARRMLASGA